MIEGTAEVSRASFPLSPVGAYFNLGGGITSVTDGPCIPPSPSDSPSFSPSFSPSISPTVSESSSASQPSPSDSPSFSPSFSPSISPTVSESNSPSQPSPSDSPSFSPSFSPSVTESPTYTLTPFNSSPSRTPASYTPPSETPMTATDLPCPTDSPDCDQYTGSVPTITVSYPLPNTFSVVPGAWTNPPNLPVSQGPGNSWWFGWLYFPPSVGLITTRTAGIGGTSASRGDRSCQRMCWPRKVKSMYCVGDIQAARYELADVGTNPSNNYGGDFDYIKNGPILRWSSGGECFHGFYLQTLDANGAVLTIPKRWPTLGTGGKARLGTLI